MTTDNREPTMSEQNRRPEECVKKWLDSGYSPVAVAMICGGPVGTEEYHRVLRELDHGWGKGCPRCGEPCLGTGDCNCGDF